MSIIFEKNGSQNLYWEIKKFQTPGSGRVFPVKNVHFLSVR